MKRDNKTVKMLSLGDLWYLILMLSLHFTADANKDINGANKTFSSHKVWGPNQELLLLKYFSGLSGALLTFSTDKNRY